MTLPDINHPRMLIGHWRNEAQYLREAIPGDARPEDVKVIRGQAALLDKCATELENRLLWSGMLDP